MDATTKKRGSEALWKQEKKPKCYLSYLILIVDFQDSFKFTAD